ncbi:lysozyme [Vibrio sp. ABG19]|uniref:lysozyme n=1 Tax=Vibrio sp. ABG19 TaxID=2817385 RepID=UPI00249DC59C|nr:lysozyme [Vibrio sp. ABG19]WGY45044.1 lysozyme [Vibrio sp. ABG19]
MSRISKTVKVLVAAGASALTIAVSMVKPFEGHENVPYRDVVGVLTVCNGHTGSDIVEGKVYTQAECESLLEQDLLAVKRQVDPLIPPAIPVTTRAALYSFTYNVGVGAFKRSTLLKRLNEGDLTDACNELKRWVYAGGKKWNGLINRRQVEEEVCKLSPP